MKIAPPNRMVKHLYEINKSKYFSNYFLYRIEKLRAFVHALGDQSYLYECTSWALYTDNTVAAHEYKSIYIT